MSNQQSGYVSLLGRPNAGKSTLLNALVGQKIAGVSSKPQTTRNRILGICNHDQAQILFLDTPGMHRLRKSAKINSLMNQEAWSVIGESDLVLYMIDANIGMEGLDRDFLKSIMKATESPVALVLSKTDRMKKDRIKERSHQVAAQIAEILEEVPEEKRSFLVNPEPIWSSAKNRESLPALLDFICEFLPEAPWMYPEDDLTDRPQRFVVSELIREKTFRLLGEEIPYHTAVRIDKMEFKKNNVSIMASIIVARNSQKGMVIGKQGSKIKEIGIEAREELEKHLDQPVFLDLQVKVDPDWVDDVSLIAEYSSLELS
ncbi:GTPase Era [Pseudobacteriovorax antillogorgiicola]|uniref:GTPase Era n=1 Tax=Pseudobacteriovorax antillogorgiicola TaxID=1513793 RepID=A0A1Y6C2Q0_9BACT|nr:GTPase Era [Pseudobacteriovorax antillogorgiicola]TCS52299.1 GTP-binding protein Era [Pseudobacteriovorax antillogorgiicola]SMF30436.1 GTP-binding protein Era [Pseudobacteriovorax antillogorgiicola]